MSAATELLDTMDVADGLRAENEHLRERLDIQERVLWKIAHLLELSAECMAVCPRRDIDCLLGCQLEGEGR